MLQHSIDENSEIPSGYASITLTLAERNYSQLDNEALTILFRMGKFHSNIFRRGLVIQSDN